MARDRPLIDCHFAIQRHQFTGGHPAVDFHDPSLSEQTSGTSFHNGAD